MNPDARTLLFDWLNRAVRAALSTDPDTAAAFGALAGKVYRIDITAPTLTLFLVPEPDGFALAPESDVAPAVTLSGSLSAFARLATRGSESGALTDGQVTLAGDAEAGQALQRLLARFDFDWEELIARAVGDLPARKVGNALRGATGWARESADLSRENLADYLTEERRVLASGAALRRLEAAVSELRADTDRLAARLGRLSRPADTKRNNG